LWAVAFSFLVVAAFSTAPSPLYGLFAHRDHLSSLAITFAYAVYAVGVVVSLVLVGHLALFEIAGIVSGAGSGAIFRGSLTTVILTSGPDDRAGVLATFFTAGYAGLSVPVVGVGLLFQHLSPRVTLLIFALVVGLGILAAAPVLVHPADADPA
jgi:hypothetical protein